MTLAGLLLLAIIWAHISPKYPEFNMVRLFMNQKNELSDSKLRLNLAFLIMAWAFIQLTIWDQLTEWYVWCFATAWVLDRAVARHYLSKGKDDGTG